MILYYIACVGLLLTAIAPEDAQKPLGVLFFCILLPFWILKV